MSIDRQDFIDFCKAKGDEAIDHSSTTWSSASSSAFERCAIGSYFTHLHGRFITRNESFEFCEELNAAIGNRIVSRMVCCEPGTYKQLVEDLT